MHARAYDSDSCSIHRAIKKHGWSSFSVSVLESGIETAERLSELERRWIAKLNTMDRAVGYNLTAGGEGLSGYKHNDETRARWSALRKGRRPSQAAIEALRAMAKLPKSGETKRRMAAAATGRVLDATVRAKISAKRTKLISHDGSARSVTEWAACSGVSVSALRWRLRQGWSMDMALIPTWGAKP